MDQVGADGQPHGTATMVFADGARYEGVAGTRIDADGARCQMTYYKKLIQFIVN